MKKRTKKLLSLLLAASMVLGMNTIAFADGYWEKDTDYEEGVDDPDTETGSDNAYKGHSNRVASTNVMEWYVDEDKDLFDPYFRYVTSGSEATEKKTIQSDHLFNGTPIGISDNREWEATKGGIYEGNVGVSSNVFKLNDTTFLLVTYTAGTQFVNRDGSNEPLVRFNGRKYSPSSKAPDDEDVLWKENYDLNVYAALVTQEAGKEPVLIANTLSWNRTGKKAKEMMTIDIKPKNNIYANVSRNGICDEKGNYLGHPAIENPYLKSGAYPYFTIKVKLDKSLKQYAKDLKKATGQDGKALNKAEFKFDIMRNCFAEAGTALQGKKNEEFLKTWQENVSKYDHVFSEKKGFRHLYPEITTDDYEKYHKDIADDPDWNVSYAKGNLDWIATRKLESDGYNIGKLSLFTDAKKVGKDIKTYMIVAQETQAEKVTSSGWSRSGKFVTYKLKKGKDYEADTSLGDGILLLKPIGNFEGDGAIFRNVEYTIPAGWDTDYKKEKKVTELRVGIYNLTGADNNWYVDSVD